MSNFFSGNNNSSNSSIDNKRQDKQNNNGNNGFFSGNNGFFSGNSNDNSNDNNNSWFSGSDSDDNGNSWFSGNNNDNNNDNSNNNSIFSSIDKKKNTKAGGNGNPDDDKTLSDKIISYSGWCLTSLILTLILGAVSANFIFFTNLTPEGKNFFFPNILTGTYEQYPYKNTATQNGGKKQKGGNIINQINSMASEYTCKGRDTVTMPKISLDFLKILGLPPSEGWPYTLIGPDSDESEKLKNWLGLTVADSYAFVRNILVKILTIFNPNGMLGGDLTRGTLGIMFFLLAIAFCWLWAFISWGYTVYSGITRGFNINFIYGLFLIFPSFILAPCTAFLQILQFIATFSILPLIINPNLIRKILACNQEPLTYLFAGLCISGAGSIFDNTTMAVMIIVYIIFVLKALLFN